MDAERPAGIIDGVVEESQVLEEADLGVGNFGDGSKRDENAQLVLVVVLNLGEADVHLGGALGVADVGVLLNASDVGHVIEGGGDVVDAHLVPGEGPVVLLVLPDVVLGVALGVGVAAGVAEPDVVAGTGSDESRGDVVVVHNPAVGGVKHAVLHHDGGLTSSEVIFLARNAELGQNIAIVSGDGVSLIAEAVFLAQFLEVQMSITSIIPVLYRTTDDFGLDSFGHSLTKSA